MSKYDKIQREKLSAKGKEIYDKLRKASSGFKKTEGKVGVALDKFYGKVEATAVKEEKKVVKAVKKAEPKAKAKAKPKAKAKKKAEPKTKKPAYKNVNQGRYAKLVAKMSKEEGISYKEAQKKASKQIRDEKDSKRKESKDKFDNLISHLRTKKGFEDGRGLDRTEEDRKHKIGSSKGKNAKRKAREFGRDAQLPAKAFGKRVSKKGNVYYEYRDNRADVKQPQPSEKPRLADGGMIESYDVAAPYGTYAKGGMVKYKKVRTLNDMKNDPRVGDVYKDDSTGETVWWMHLKEGFISDWDGCGTITSDDNMKYLKDTLNTKGVVVTEEKYNTSTYAKGGKVKDYKVFVEEYPNGYNIRVKFGKENRTIELSDKLRKSKSETIAFAKRLAEKNNGSYEGFKVVYSYAKGGEVEINEDGSNIPSELRVVFSEFNEDEDSYKEMERLRLKAQEVGYDFDYDLSGQPTEFFKFDDYIDPITKANNEYENEKSERLYQSDEWVEAQRNAEGYAKGGITKGQTLAENFNMKDEVQNVEFWKNDVIVKDKQGKLKRIDLDKGERISLNAKGGETHTMPDGSTMLNSEHYAKGGKVSKDKFFKSKEAEKLFKQFKSIESKTEKGLDEYYDFIDGLVEKGLIDERLRERVTALTGDMQSIYGWFSYNMKQHAKGGNIGRDGKFLSEEKHEQAYKPKPKKSYKRNKK